MAWTRLTAGKSSLIWLVVIVCSLFVVVNIASKNYTMAKMYQSFIDEDSSLRDHGPLSTTVHLSNEARGDYIVGDDHGAGLGTVTVYTPPKNETPRKRFPHSVVIGFPKCGTRATLAYLSIHPYVSACGPEVHFYNSDTNFKNGYSWYLKQMPLSYSNQVTIEKTPAYVSSQRALDEIFNNFPSVKLIVLVRDPVVRLMSAIAQYKAKNTHRNIIAESYYKINNTLFTGKSTVQAGVYITHLSKWFAKFPRENILVISGEDLIQDPLTVMNRVEKFLDIPNMFTTANFFLNATSGFYCFKGFRTRSANRCLGAGKGRPHDTIAREDEEGLYQFYEPFNRALFQLVGTEFDWSIPNMTTS